MSTINHIGVLTSGGDSPGMNAAIRAVVRTATYHKKNVTGIIGGYSGLIQSKMKNMQSHDVSKIIQLGGTILKSSRCPEFTTPEGRQQAYESLQQAHIDALVVIGGDGTFRGATAFGEQFDFPIVGVPATIDNDIYGTDFTIGYDTALNTVVQAVDKIRDTADSHNMLFMVEVMGRDAGFIALNTAIATGAETTLIPEIKTNVAALCDYLRYERRKNKSSAIVIVAEGEDIGTTFEIAAQVKEIIPEYPIRVTVLGHIQRGGSPTCNDRVLASNLGYEAVMSLLRGERGVMIGQENNKTVLVPFTDINGKHKDIDHKLYEMAHILSS